MTILDDINKRDEETRKLLVDELDWCSAKIAEFLEYQSSLRAEMRKRGFVYDGASSTSTKSIDKPPGLGDLILELLSDGIPRSNQEIFDHVSKIREKTDKIIVGKRLNELRSASKISATLNTRDKARPGSYLYSCIRPAIVETTLKNDKPDNVVQLPIEDRDYPIGKLIMRYMGDGKKRTKEEIFTYVRQFNTKTNMSSIAARLSQLGLTSEIEKRTTGNAKVYYFPIASTSVKTGS